jgi:hypothetical protein
MIELADSIDRSLSFDSDSGAGRDLTVRKRGAPAGSRLGSIIYITASVTATIGWLWFLVDVAEWLIGS